MIDDIRCRQRLSIQSRRAEAGAYTGRAGAYPERAMAAATQAERQAKT